MGRFDDYVNYFDTYQKIYGERTTVLYQCGMFYEVYGIDNQFEKLGHAAEIAQLLNIQLTRTDKSNPENNRSNPLMTGFPVNYIERHLRVLIDNNYTVVIVDQVREKIVGGKKVQEREVTAIHSPATYVNNYMTENYLVCIYLDSHKLKGKTLYDIGLTAIDLSTGKNYAHQSLSTNSDSFRSLDDTYRFIQTLQPTEIIYASPESKPTSLFDNLSNMDNVLLHKREPKASFLKNSFHNQYLREFFPDSGLLSVVEYLDLDFKQSTAIAYCIMLEFCKDHNKNLLKQLKRPTIWDNNKTLILDNNAINQLNLINTGRHSKNGSVLDIITETSTNMGKRLLKTRLLNPEVNLAEINRRYSYIELMMEIVSDKIILNLIKSKKDKLNWYLVVEQYLREITDIERYHRKIETGTLQPTEYTNLYNSYTVITKLIELIRTHKFFELVGEQLSIEFKKYLDDCNVIDLEKASKYNLNDITDNFFKKGYSTVLDDYAEVIRENKTSLESLAEKLSSFSKSGHVTVKNSDEGYYLHTTKARFKIIEKNFKPFKILVDRKEVSINKLNVFTFDNRTKTATKIRGSYIDLFSSNVKENISKLQNEVRDQYLKFLAELSEKYAGLYSKLVYFVAEIDVYKSGAKCAIKNNYNKPVLHESENSWFKVKNLRHPLIEKIETHRTYIPHSLSLDSEGMLLYGINASGKSSIMKAVGIAVILAQAGFYVPCEEFDLGLYRKIMTRILGNDNIFKGLSSYAVEITELRGITARADQNSLILGDEICHGTETYSAISIVVSSIIHLAKMNSSFIFATHLHQIADMSEITELENVKQKHLTVTYDDVNDELIYDRKLKDGPGDTLYGIEVAKFLKMPEDIITMAMEIRKKYFSETKHYSQSIYNKEIYVDLCRVCNSEAMEVHHIKFQSEAENNYIDHIHKNHKSNLVPLCEKHHDMVHHPDGKELIIFGYKSTGDLDYTFRKPLRSFKVKKISIL